MYRKISHNIAMIFVILVIMSLFLSVIVSIWYQQVMSYVIFVSRLFEVMFPVLAVSALVKYLICNNCHCSSEQKHDK